MEIFIEMEILILLASISFGITFHETTKPNELLQSYARFVNMKIENFYLKKLFLCPHCLAGQFALWSIVLGVGAIYLKLVIVICVSIFITKKIVCYYE
jgi:hypothetical protein